MFCGKCGSEVSENGKFCPKCGNVVRKVGLDEGKNAKGTKKKIRTLQIVGGALLLVLLLLALFIKDEFLGERDYAIKLRDLDFVILSEERIPVQLKTIIEEQKKMPFQITYTDNSSLYICIGYGEQKTGGYSIMVNELYLSDQNIVVSTSLLEPEAAEKGNKTPSYPYIVIKTEFHEQMVEFRNISEVDSDADSDSLYISGVYTEELVLNNQPINVEVIVNQDVITSIRMVDLNDAITTMYPLLKPTFDSICEQCYAQQSLENIVYTADTKYTSMVLLEAIQDALNKAAGNH